MRKERDGVERYVWIMKGKVNERKGGQGLERKVSSQSMKRDIEKGEGRAG